MIETNLFFLQKEVVNRITLKHKIGTQSYRKCKKQGSSSRNYPTMPKYGSTPPPYVSVWAIFRDGRLYGGEGGGVLEETLPYLKEVWNFWSLFYIVRSLGVPIYCFMSNLILLTPSFCKKNQFVSITFSFRDNWTQIWCNFLSKYIIWLELSNDIFCTNFLIHFLSSW